ncbi:hypothetical protein AMS68_007169 [Peltaster fructicola]|uniref:DNA polymerase lambda n=1 Tax=Peltaster fructicola TaxID=286661 RepID=A0A6H0Y3Q3_9PEZI|nr:hypothetical protein AMS68_007169 [Peltaster fructicola]
MTVDEDEKLERKRGFYDTFSLLEKSDGEIDLGLQASKAIFDRAAREPVRLPKQPRLPPAIVQEPPCKGSTVGDEGNPPLKVNRAAQPAQSEPVVAQPPTLSAPPPSAIPRTTSKRKDKDVIKLAPEAQRIFAGLQFYFFPNNDTNLARRLRITKALEYGASWQKDWNRFVTHVIVDINLDYATLLKHLELSAIPDDIAVVNEVWPAECLSYRTLLDTSRTMFTVRGLRAQPAEAAVDTDTVLSLISDDSLVLKSAGKASKATTASTPEAVADAPNLPDAASTQADRTHHDMHTEPTILADNMASLPEEFRDLVTQAKQFTDVPLEDSDSDSDRQPSSSGRAVTSHDGELVSSTDVRPGTKKLLTEFDRFQCMTAHTGDSDNGPNAEVIKVLQQMADYYGRVGDEWRLRAYRKGIASLRNRPTKIVTKDQALAIPNIGARLADKIEEIAFTHRLRRLDHAQAEPGDQALQLFMQVYDVGYARASGWVRAGHRTLEDLLEQEKRVKGTLTSGQKVGIKHFEDFNLRIPRAEVEQHGAIVRQCLLNEDPAFELIIGGSYRRGAAVSSDIDCVITHPAWSIEKMREVVNDTIIPRLEEQGFITATLSKIGLGDGSKWLGVSRLESSKVHRRLDFLLVPAVELGAAMIYFTGNDIFNRSMRLLASKKGLRLNQHGLWRDVIRGKNRERVTQGTIVEGRDERKIFEILGVPWREPHERLI